MFDKYLPTCPSLQRKRYIAGVPSVPEPTVIKHLTLG